MASEVLSRGTDELFFIYNTKVEIPGLGYFFFLRMEANTSVSNQNF